MEDEDLMRKMGDDTELDKAEREVMSKPITEEELKGFGRRKIKLPSVWPYVKYIAPSRTDGPKGHAIEIGIGGKF